MYYLHILIIKILSKKCTNLTLIFLLVTRTSLATVHIVNNNSNAPSGHYPTIAAAQAAASSNDTIYVVGSPKSYDGGGGSFYNKPLTYIGAGYKPQKDFNYPSTIIGFFFIEGNGDCKIFGFNITAGIYTNTASFPVSGNNLEIAYNTFSGHTQIELGSGCNLHDNIIYVGFDTYLWILGSNNRIHNNIFSTSKNYNANILTKRPPHTNNKIYNNLFLSASSAYVFKSIEGFEVANNIFYGYSIADTTSHTVPINCNFNNNIVYNTGNNFVLFGNNYSSSGINYIGTSPLFVNPTPNFTFDFPPFDFRLQAGSVGHNGGTDGKDIGPFGGLNPFNNFTGMQDIPVVKKLDIINPIVGVSDSLRIQIIATNILASTFSSAEYFFDTDPGQGNGIPIKVTSTDSNNSLVNISHGLAIGNHVIGYRVMNANRVWSMPDIRSFRVCTVSGPVAGFNYYLNGQDVIFENTSTDQQGCHWDFGDGDTSNNIQSILVHHFDSAGIFNVCLNSKNVCKPDGGILCKQVTIKGIKSIFPNNGGNIGLVTMIINGALFNQSTTVKLTKAGESDIIPLASSTIISNGTKVQTVFDLKGASIGLWDVVVEVPSDTTFILINGFRIDTGIRPEPYVKLVGSIAIRFNRWQNYSIVIGNRGNVDALAVPIWFAVPNSVSVKIKFDFVNPPDTIININWDTVPLFLRTDTLFNMVGDFKIYGFLIPCVFGGLESYYNIELLTKTNGVFNVYSWVSKPEYYTDSSQVARYQNLPDSECEELNNQYNCLVGSLGLIPVFPIPCAVDLWLYVQGLTADAACAGIRDNDRLKPSNISRDLLFTIASCVPPVDVASTIIYLSGYFFNAKQTIKACDDGFGIFDAYDRFVNSLSSFDPNNKYGGGGILNSPYLNSELPFNYSIHFENIETATAPAQTVILIDTLDNTNLDLSTLQLTSLGFADTIISIPPGKQSFTTDVDLRPSLPIIARATAFVNPSTHILTCKFESLDPLTKEPADSVFLGFLLPNDSTGRGEGFINYSVKAKKGIPTGTVIKNKADIYFDNNPPIATQTWPNIIDDLKPQSQVNALPQFTYSDSIRVSWLGKDNGPAGLYIYKIYYNVNGGSWRLWKYNTSLTNDVFIGAVDSTYGFYSVAIDSALNVEDHPLIPDAITKISSEKVPNIKNSIQAYPIPAKNLLNIIIHSDQSTQIHIVLTDMFGRKIRDIKNNIIIGKNNFTLDIQNLPDGQYILKSYGPLNLTSEKFIIIH
jgi:hypothetical protein